MNIKPLATVWLEAKSKQSDLSKKRESLIKLIDARKNRLANLQTTIQADIDDFLSKINSVDVQMQGQERIKDSACLDMLDILQNGGDE